MEIKRAIEILKSGIKMPDVPHTSDELDTAIKLACKCLELYDGGYSPMEVGVIRLENERLKSENEELVSEHDELYNRIYDLNNVDKRLEAIKGFIDSTYQHKDAAVKEMLYTIDAYMHDNQRLTTELQTAWKQLHEEIEKERALTQTIEAICREHLHQDCEACALYCECGSQEECNPIYREDKQ